MRVGVGFPVQRRAIRKGAGREDPGDLNIEQPPPPCRAGTPQEGARDGGLTPAGKPGHAGTSRKLSGAVPTGPGPEWAVGGAPGSHAPSIWPDPSYHCSGGHPASTPAHSYRLTRPPSRRRSPRPGATWQLRGGEQGGRGLRSWGGWLRAG